MGLGLGKIIKNGITGWNSVMFSLRRKVLGFDNANAYLRTLDKHAMIPVLLRNGAKIGHNCDIEAPLLFHNCRDFSNLIVGNNVHIGKNCFFDLRGKVVIEDNVVISMQNTFITHMDLGKSNLRNRFPASHSDILIMNNSYIGANSTILMGVCIGEYSVIAAGSVVNKNVEAYTVSAGVPAKEIKSLRNLDPGQK